MIDLDWDRFLTRRFRKNAPILTVDKIRSPVMTLNDLINKTCLIGLTYFDSSGKLLKQSQLCGTVLKADAEVGISVQLKTLNSTREAKLSSVEEPPVFIIPADLSPWFNAPAGTYRGPDNEISIIDPDFLVTWDIHQTKEPEDEGQHLWWHWLPRTSPPQVSG